MARGERPTRPDSAHIPMSHAQRMRHRGAPGPRVSTPPSFTQDLYTAQRAAAPSSGADFLQMFEPILDRYYPQGHERRARAELMTAELRELIGGYMGYPIVKDIAYAIDSDKPWIMAEFTAMGEFHFEAYGTQEDAQKALADGITEADAADAAEMDEFDAPARPIKVFSLAGA